MSKKCGQTNVEVKPADPCCCAKVTCGAEATQQSWAGEWFDEMISHCLEYAEAEHERGRPVVGICCEYTPRELLLAAGGVPVCLCGGSTDTIPAAEEHLPANLCPLIKSTYGYHVQQANPFLEMADLVVAETTCDGKKKMYDLLAETREVYVLELPQKPEDPDAAYHWRRELEKLKAFLEDRYDVEITDARLREAIGLMNRERRLRRELAELMAADVPPLTGRQLLQLKSIISAIPADLEEYRRVIDRLRESEPSKENAGRPRVLLTGVPIAHGAERVLEIIEDSGGLVVCTESCTGLKPILEDVREDGDPLDALAEKYLHLPCSVMTPNERRFESLRELAEQYRAECVIDLSWQACLTYDVEAGRVRRLAEQQLNRPYLRISTDYSPSDSARIEVRVQALLETVKARR